MPIFILQVDIYVSSQQLHGIIHVESFLYDESLSVLRSDKRTIESMPCIEPLQKHLGADVGFQFGAARIKYLRTVSHCGRQFPIRELRDVHDEARRDRSRKHEMGDGLRAVTGLSRLPIVLGEPGYVRGFANRSEEHTSELQSLRQLVCRPL